jgi:hypothetical protein
MLTIKKTEKIQNTQIRAGVVAQAVERLPSKHKALNSILNTTKKKKRKV